MTGKVSKFGEMISGAGAVTHCTTCGEGRLINPSAFGYENMIAASRGIKVDGVVPHLNGGPNKDKSIA